MHFSDSPFSASSPSRDHVNDSRILLAGGTDVKREYDLCTFIEVCLKDYASNWLIPQTGFATLMISRATPEFEPSKN